MLVSQDLDDFDGFRSLKLPVDRSFPAFLSRNSKDGASFKISSSFEAEKIGHEGQEVLEYVKKHQALDREERAAWKDAQNMQTEADVELAKIRAEVG